MKHHRPSRRALLRGACATIAAPALLGCSSARPRGLAPTEDFPELSDQSARWTPIQPEERAQRRARAAALLREAQLDALFLEPGATMTYLTGVGWGKSERLFGVALYADGSLLWVVPAFEAPRAEELLAATGSPGEILRWDEHEYAFAPLAARLRAGAPGRIALEPELRVFVAEGLAAELGADRLASGRALVRDLRATKDAHELELLRAASELTKQALVAAAARLRPGDTDFELGRLVTRAQEKLGLRQTWVLPLLGERAAYPHGAPDGRVLSRGSVILVDTGGALHGYQSDVTRTWVFDAPATADIERAWWTVRDAQARAFEAMRPGVECRAIDRVAREHIERAGFGEGYSAFAHRLGHGIGLQGHEDPYFDGGSTVVLRPGMTLSDEPGIYVPGRFGIRLEDIVVITASGAEVLGPWATGPSAPQ